MKILRLTLSNLNSLQGSTSIDFTTPPLSNSGLFAITGPTGAGKSTLLDAITLALYGRAARYGNAPNPDAVMSRHTGECSAEVEFSCAGGTFCSVWQLQRARKKPDGNLQQAKRRIIALPSKTIIAEGIRDADAKILELTGLDYDRFLRSVLLAQGDFAAFLKAGPRERTDLLQQVTGTGIYQEISKASYRRSADAKQAHDALLATHAAVAVLTLGERQRHEQTRDSNSGLVNNLTVHLQDLGRRTNEAQIWLDIETASASLAAERAAYDIDTAAAASAFAQLQRHERAVDFIAQITCIDRIKLENSNDQTALQELEASLPALAARVQLAESAAQRARNALQTDESGIATLQLLWNEVIDLDRALATYREALRQTSIHHTSLEQTVSDLAGELKHDRDALQTATDEHTGVAAWLADHTVDAILKDQLPEIKATAARWTERAASALQAQQDLDTRRHEVEQLLSSVRACEVQLPPLQSLLKAQTDATETANRTIETASEQMSLVEIEEHRDQSRDHRLALEKLCADALRLRTEKHDLDKVADQASQTAAELETVTFAIDHVQQQLNAATRLLNARRETLAYAEKVQSLEEHLAALHDDEPCPLCGSVHHPYALAGVQPSAALASIRRDVDEAEAATNKAKDAFSKEDRRHAFLTSEQTRLAGDQSNRHGAYATQLTAWNSAASLIGFAGQFEDEGRLTAQVKAAKTEESRRSQQVAAVRAAELVFQKAKLDQQTSQIEVDRVRNEIATKSALTAQVQGQLPALETILADHRGASLQQQTTFAQSVAPFVPVVIALAGVPGLLDELTTRAASYDLQNKNCARCAIELGVLTSTYNAHTQQHATAVLAAAASGKALTFAQQNVGTAEGIRTAKFGNRLVADVQREAEAALARLRHEAVTTQTTSNETRQFHTTAVQEKNRLESAIAARTEEYQGLVLSLRSAATVAGFASDQELRSAILIATEATTMSEQRDALRSRGVAIATQTNDLASRLVALPPSASRDAPNLVALRSEHRDRTDERDTLQSSIGEVRAILKGDDERRFQQAAYTVQIDAAHREYARWDKLSALIGSADGSLFARFAQGLTLERLTVLANCHLQQLNPRYAIRRAADDEAGDLELEIVDHYQAEATRPMRSLSGGESFLVSLALALGLSELASGGTSIESLFIDEGFGSLDADTLEMAMSALESLHAGGKTIGIISHVPAMQERIPTQINVTKESGGVSSVTIVA